MDTINCENITFEFDQEQYDTCLKRLHYDDRDTIMYENMLSLLWKYMIDTTCLKNKRILYKEYCTWNRQMIDKCFYHLPHDIPYANMRRAYETIPALIFGDMDHALELIDEIGTDNFSYDGKPEKKILHHGKCYMPCSKLFLLYNIAKVMNANGMENESAAFQKKYAYAFTSFQDDSHEEHNRYLKKQMEEEADQITYPVFDRVYKLQGGPSDFFLYEEPKKRIPIKNILYSVDFYHIS